MTQKPGTPLASPHADPWARETEFVDLDSLNAEVSDAVIDAVNGLRQRAVAREQSRPATAIVAVGPAGAGKTHLFGRLRRKLGPRAVLVHVRPLLAAEMDPRFLLGQVVQQLGYPSLLPHVAQIDIVAGAALAIGLDENPRYPTAQLASLRELPQAERDARLDTALDGLCRLFPDADPTYLHRLLQVPFASGVHRIALIVWLSGREPDDAQAARVGVKERLPDSAVVTALRTIAAVSAVTAPLLIVFDQLENLVDPSGGAGRIVAYGNLLAELVDSVKDAVIVQMGLSTEWQAHIVPRLGMSHQSRVSGRQLPLGLPRQDQARELLRLWIGKALPDATFPAPFTESQMQVVCDMPGSTPRMLLLELNRVLEGQEPLACAAPPPAAVPEVAAGATGAPPAATASPSNAAAAAEDARLRTREALQSAWNEQLTWARDHIAEMERSRQGPEPGFLLDGFKSLAAVVAGVGGVEAVSTTLARVIGPHGTRFVALVCDPSDASVRKAFRTLADREPVLAVRERWRDFPPTWRSTREQFEQFRKRKGVTWLWLDRDDAVRLLALQALLRDARSADVAGGDGKPVALDDVLAWVKKEVQPEQWTASQVLLGKPPPDEADQSAPPPPGAPQTSSPAQGPSAAHTAASRILRTLRVASMERVLRETVKASPGSSRAAVLAELRANPSVRFIGETIVAWDER